MTFEDVIAKFDSRSRWLKIQGGLMMVLILVLLGAGAWAVMYAQNITAADIGAPTAAQKQEAVRKELDKVSLRQNQIREVAGKNCLSVLSEGLKQWAGKGYSKEARAYDEQSLSGDEIVSFVEGHINKPNSYRFELRGCGPGTWIQFVLTQPEFPDFKSKLSGKTFVSPVDAAAVAEFRGLIDRSTALQTILQQLNLEKIMESEAGLLKPTATETKSGNDLFLKLLQTTITRFGLLAVIGFLVGLLVSLYRYNIRLAAFYTARADVLRLSSGPLSVSDFSSLAASLTPTVEFGKAPQAPIGQLVELVKTTKDAAK